MSKRGVLEGQWGFLSRDMDDRVFHDIMDYLIYPKENTMKVRCWGIGGQEGGYLEEFDIFWVETWRTGSSLASLMTLVDPKEETLKTFMFHLYGKCVENGGSRSDVLGGHWGLLTGGKEDRIILNIMGDLGSSKGPYPKSFRVISIFWHQKS